jgi:integration host factor subunit alpha
MSNVSQKMIIPFPKELRASIVAGLLEYGKVKVSGLGIFEIKLINARKGRNPATGEVMTMPAYRKIKFRPTASIKQNLL